MENIFISKIHIEKVNDLRDFDINLSLAERKHLVITGYNGSGKTSLLKAIKKRLEQEQKSSYLQKAGIPSQLSASYLPNIHNHGVNLCYNNPIFPLTKVIVTYFSASRSKINKPKFQNETQLTNKSSLLEYMLTLSICNQNSEQSSSAQVSVYQNCFESLQMALREILDFPRLELIEDVQNLTYNIQLPNERPFALHKLSDGYASVLNIYMGLTMQIIMAQGQVNRSVPVIALIDDLGSHLHVAEQKKIFPFLVKKFPATQFIITTHSPFVVTALDNSVVYDIGKKIALEKSFFYSYKTLIESYLDSDSYYAEMDRYFERYKELASKECNDDELVEMETVRLELKSMSPAYQKLYAEFIEFEKKR
jgi:predicted ATP-binding protein involved in virulence